MWTVTAADPGSQASVAVPEPCALARQGFGSVDQFLHGDTRVVKSRETSADGDASEIRYGSRPLPRPVTCRRGSAGGRGQGVQLAVPLGFGGGMSVPPPSTPAHRHNFGHEYLVSQFSDVGGHFQSGHRVPTILKESSAREYTRRRPCREAPFSSALFR